MENIPDWAIERAIELCGNQHASTGKVKRCPAGFASLLSFARYIAEHEEAPVDPLIAEATAIWAEYAAGPDEAMILAALRRGIELAKDTPHV